jgi:hypothetical protein
MMDDQLAAIQAAIAVAVRTGALIQRRIDLEEGEWDQRSLWLRPDINDLINSTTLEAEQCARVKAALRRFVTGGAFNVVTADSPHQEVAGLGDMRELKGPPPPFVELRFKPPKHSLRMLGRFIRRDGLILTSFGMKSLEGATGRRPFSIPGERSRCDDFFKGQKLELKWVPNRIEDSLSNATFAWGPFWCLGKQPRRPLQRTKKRLEPTSTA